MRISNFEGEQFLILEHSSEAFLVNQAVDRIYGRRHQVAKHLREVIDDVVHDCVVEAVAVFDESEGPLVLRAVKTWAGIDDDSVESAQARWMIDSLDSSSELTVANQLAA